MKTENCKLCVSQINKQINKSMAKYGYAKAEKRPKIRN